MNIQRGEIIRINLNPMPKDFVDLVVQTFNVIIS